MRRQLLKQYDLWGHLTHKECGRCWGVFPLVDFATRSECEDGKSSWCKGCQTNRHTETYVKQTRDRALRRAYDLTQDAWNALFEAQRRCCAACGTTEPGSKRGWHTDHIHGTKIVRGILCNGCNLAIGHLKDDPVRAEKLAEYLRRGE
jgi:hypothetical protein